MKRPADRRRNRVICFGCKRWLHLDEGGEAPGKCVWCGGDTAALREDAERIAGEMWGGGESLGAIATRLGVHRDTVGRLLRDVGLRVGQARPGVRSAARRMAEGREVVAKLLSGELDFDQLRREQALQDYVDLCQLSSNPKLPEDKRGELILARRKLEGGLPPLRDDLQRRVDRVLSAAELDELHGVVVRARALRQKVGEA